MASLVSTVLNNAEFQAYKCRAQVTWGSHMILYSYTFVQLVLQTCKCSVNDITSYLILQSQFSFLNLPLIIDVVRQVLMLRLSWPDGTFMSLKGGLWAHWPCECQISVVDSCGARGGEVVGAKEPLWIAVIGWHVDTGNRVRCSKEHCLHTRGYPLRVLMMQHQCSPITITVLYMSQSFF